MTCLASTFVSIIYNQVVQVIFLHTIKSHFRSTTVNGDYFLDWEGRHSCHDSSFTRAVFRDYFPNSLQFYKVSQRTSYLLTFHLKIEHSFTTTLHRTRNNLNSAGRRCILTLTMLLSTFVFLLLCMRVGEDTPHEEDARGTTEASFAPSVVKKCKFEDLATSFRSPRDSSHQSSACWKIEDEIVEIPTSAILNRNNMTRLGRGFKGGVFKALIQLKDESTCYAALKTDQCSSNQGRNYRYSVPCVADGAYKTSQSFMKGEITGMLVHYAFYRRGLEVPQGILPTYAVVKAAKAPKTMKYEGRSNNITYPAEDPLQIGVIMPLREFDDIERQTDLPETFSAIAAVMSPAAIALQTYHTLGLAHGDVYITNIAIDKDTGKAVLYDNSVVAKQGDCAGKYMRE